MLIVLLVIIGLALLILAHEAGHFFVAKAFKLKIDEFGFGFPPKIFGRKRGETEYSLNWLPLGGFVRIAGENDRLTGNLDKFDSYSEAEKKRIFLFQPSWKRSLVILAGVTVNFLLGWLIISFIFMRGIPSALIISNVQKDSPAAAAGLMTGDVVTNYFSATETYKEAEEGKRVPAFIEFVNNNRGKEITVEVSRDGEKLSFTAVPRLAPGPNEGALGVELGEAGVEAVGFFEALSRGFKQTLLIAWMTLIAFGQLVKNLVTQGALLEGVVGPVGIFAVAEQTGRIALIYLLQLMAAISINLAVINLIPFPALDGGRFFMILVEKLKGSPISRRAEALLNGLGFAFLIVLIVLITIRDVSRF